MRFQVPQFIDVEDRIIGPLTLKQFLYVAAAGGILFVLFYVFNFFIFMMLAPLIGGAAITLAFWKINGRDFLIFLSALLNFFLKPRSYRWRKIAPPKPLDTPEDRAAQPGQKPKPPEHGSMKTAHRLNKLRALAWQLDSMKKIKH